MQRHMLYGVINENIDRPCKDIIERLKNTPVARIADVMGGSGLMHHEIKPVENGQRICGPAVTAFCRQGDTLWLQRVGDSAQEGDIITVDAGGGTSLSVVGEIISYYMYAIRKVNGLVIDGAIRDRLGLLKVGVPVFARGIDPKLFGAIGPGAINVPIQCGGVFVKPGDIIVGDEDGVVVVPKDDAERVIGLIEHQSS